MKYILLSPAVVLFLLFTAWPLVEVVRLSMLKTNFITTKFIGFENYIVSLSDPAFVQSFFNSLGYAIVLVPNQLLFSLLASLVVFKLSKRWQDISRIIFYIPTLSAGIIISQVWRWIFHPDGLVNWLLSTVGFTKIDWFSDAFTSIPVIGFIVASSAFGGSTIMILAAILGIDKNIFEAARIDGANWRQIGQKIIVPLIIPVLSLLAIIGFIGSFQIFETIYALCPQEYATTMTFYIYQQGFQFSKYGMASAQAILLLIGIISINFIVVRIKK